MRCRSQELKTATKRVSVGVVVLVLLSGAAFGAWDDAKGRGLFPYWSTGGPWITLFIFVNGSEDTEETIYFELRGVHDSLQPERREFPLPAGQMLILSTSRCVGEWVTPSAGYGYALFRCQDGGMIHPFCAVVNLDTGVGYTVPAYRQDRGF
ncbi:MAG: hypothetical protein JW759_03925 [Candidatus Coatesbacteria bacterium]|nr:hypothetical protein [Candidatus Coatesbacteria bacterium]